MPRFIFYTRAHYNNTHDTFYNYQIYVFYMARYIICLKMYIVYFIKNLPL